jgi:hypothetical protein
MMKFWPIFIFIFLLGSLGAFSQRTVELKPANGPYRLNIYYPDLSECKSFVVYEKIDNRFTFSNSPNTYRHRYKFDQFYNGRIWQDSANGLIIIHPDTTGPFSFRLRVMEGDSIVDELSYGMSSEPLPDPTVKFYSYHKDFISPKDLGSLDYLVGVTERFPYYIRYRIDSFSITIVDQNNNVKRHRMSGYLLPIEVKQELSECKRGSKIIIDQIAVTRQFDQKRMIARPRIIAVE